jgi:hypothetical protein
VAHCVSTTKKGDTMTHCVAEYMQGDTQPFYTETHTPRYYNYKRKDEDEPISMTTDALKTLAHDLLNPKPKKVMTNLFGTMVETLQAGKVTQADKDEDDFITKTLLHKTIAERDKKIRYAQTCDRIAFLMLKDWFSGSELTIDTDTLTLNDCFLPPNLNRQTDPFARQSFLDKPFEMQIKVSNKTITANLPLYRYGEFRRIVKDARVAARNDGNGNEIGLLAWYAADTIPRERILEELKYYNEHRHEVLEQILILEEKMHPMLNHGGNFTDHSKYTKKLAQAPYNLDKEALHIALMLRNKFGHNAILHKPMMDRNKPTERLLEDIEALLGRITQTDLSAAPLITEQLIDYTKRIYKNWNDRL